MGLGFRVLYENRKVAHKGYPYDLEATGTEAKRNW